MDKRVTHRRKVHTGDLSYCRGMDGFHGRKKKNKRSWGSSLPSEQKAHLVMERLHQLSVTNYTFEDIAKLFKDAKLDTDKYIRDVWIEICRSHHGDREHRHRPEPGLPGGDPASLEQFIHQACTFTRPPESVSPPPVNVSKLKWRKLDSKEFGVFFINKVFLDDKKDRYWQPEHMTGGATQLLSLEEVLPHEGLQRALICNDQTFDKALPLLCELPKHVQTHLVCPKEEVTVAASVDICPVHTASSRTDQSCDCAEARTVQVTQPTHRIKSRVNTKCLLLRYEDHLRLVITSCPYDRVVWERVATFGWLCDLPVTAEPPVTGSKHDVYENLKSYLDFLHIPSEPYLDNVDFSGLSPGVHLITAVPGAGGVGMHGQFKLIRLLKDVPWPNPDKPKSLCQTERLGTHRATSVLDNIFKLVPNISRYSVHKAPVQIMYPSQEHVIRCIKDTPELTNEVAQQNLSNEDRQCLTMGYLCDLDTIDNILPRANVLCQYQDITDDAGTAGRFGWVFAGSQRLGSGSWGSDKDSHGNQVQYQYEMGVAILPWVTTSDEGTELHAVDLRDVAMHFVNGVPYPQGILPYSPALTHCIGVFLRPNHKGAYGFIEEVPDQELARLYERIPDDESGTRVAFIHLDQFCNVNCQSLPPANTVVEFMGGFRGPGRRKFRAEKILRIFKSLREAVSVITGTPLPESSGVMDSVLKELMPDLAGPDVSQQDLIPEWFTKPAGKTDFNTLMLQKGVKTDEDFEELLYQTFNNRTVIKQTRDWFLANVESDFPMNPTKMSEDEVWLEKHLKSKYGGRLPPLKGPLHPTVLRMSLHEIRSRCLHGLQDP